MTVQDVYDLVTFMGLYLSEASCHQKTYKELFAHINDCHALMLEKVQHKIIRFSDSRAPRAFALTQALEGNVSCALAMVEIVREQRRQLLEAEEAVGIAVSDFRCPLGLQLMREPVMLEDGHSYEKANINRWFHQQELEEKQASSPVTRTVLQSTQLVVNLNLKNTIVAAVEDMKGQLGKHRPD